MNTLMMLLVMGAGQVTGAGENGWSDDYGAALKQAKQLGKPLLIVIEGPDDSVARLEQISLRDDRGQTALLKHYVLCRIDATTKYGKAVAKSFRATQLPHTAVIDKTVSTILYTKRGQFTSQEWKTTLTKYRHGVRVVHSRTRRQPVYCPT